MARLDELLRQRKDQGGSDLHLTTGLEPRMRTHGALEPISGWSVLDDPTLHGILQEITSEKQWDQYRTGLDLDFAYGLEGIARFRANYFYQQNGPGAWLGLVILYAPIVRGPKAVDLF